MPSTLKRCRDCGETKAVGDFYSHPETRDGLRNSCKAPPGVGRPMNGHGMERLGGSRRGRTGDDAKALMRRQADCGKPKRLPVHQVQPRRGASRSALTAAPRQIPERTAAEGAARLTGRSRSGNRIPLGELTAATERGGEQRFRIGRPRPKKIGVTGSPPIERTSPPPSSGPSLGGPSAVALQLQPVEFSDTTPPDDRLARLKQWRKWFWALERVRTPSPTTVH